MSVGKESIRRAASAGAKRTTKTTAKTADKPVSVVEDDVEMEGSTNVVAASTISSSSMKQLGESAQTQVPATTEKAKDQKATITLNQIAADADAQISSTFSSGNAMIAAIVEGVASQAFCIAIARA